MAQSPKPLRWGVLVEAIAALAAGIPVARTDLRLQGRNDTAVFTTHTRRNYKSHENLRAYYPVAFMRPG